MAGGVATPRLVAAASNAGALGTLGAAVMTPEQIREAVAEIRSLTDRPFAVNLFAPVPEAETSARTLETMSELLRPYREELGLDAPALAPPPPGLFERQAAVIVEEEVPVFSFHFGMPSPESLRELKRAEITLIGTATTVLEAHALEESGIDLIVAQGSEAGGHRGTFVGDFEAGMAGLVALVPKIVDRVAAPVIAAGGIMDGRGVAAALALGAAGVQMGSAFLTCDESGASPAHKQALQERVDETTAVTRAFTGRPARALRNRLVTEIEERAVEIPGFPLQGLLTRELTGVAAGRGARELMALYAGQGVSRRGGPAGVLVAELVRETAEVFERLAAGAPGPRAPAPGR